MNHQIFERKLHPRDDREYASLSVSSIHNPRRPRQWETERSGPRTAYVSKPPLARSLEEHRGPCLETGQAGIRYFRLRPDFLCWRLLSVAHPCNEWTVKMENIKIQFFELDLK